MKPRNKLERDLQAVVDGGGIRPLTAKQMQQAYKAMERSGGKLFLFASKQKTNGMDIRTFYKAHRYGRNCEMTLYHLIMVRAQRDGQTAWCGRHTGMSYFIDDFSYFGDVTIKQPKNWYEHYFDGIKVLSSRGREYPYAVTRTLCLNQYEWRDSRIETIAKNGDEGLLRYLMNERKPLSYHLWRSYIVAHRHGVNLAGDAFFWASLVNLLRLNKYDCRSPKYICPADTHEAYMKMVHVNDVRLQAVRHNADKKKQDKEAVDYASRYIKEHKKWLGVVIKGRGIVIKPLQSVEEFKQEAEAMEHCVYANAYYKKRHSLVLSARDNSGNRLATIEYDTKGGRVLQCRAKRNAQPEKYDIICRLVNKHLKTQKK